MAILPACDPPDDRERLCAACEGVIPDRGPEVCRPCDLEAAASSLGDTVADRLESVAEWDLAPDARLALEGIAWSVAGLERNARDANVDVLTALGTLTGVAAGVEGLDIETAIKRLRRCLVVMARLPGVGA